MKNAHLETLGERIRHVRKMLGLKQAHFALKIGLNSPTAISKYEKNQVEPSIASLLKIAEIGNIDPGWLLSGRSKGEIAPSGLDVRASEVIESYGEPDGADILAKAAEILASKSICSAALESRIDSLHEIVQMKKGVVAGANERSSDLERKIGGIERRLAALEKAMLEKNGRE